MIKDLFVKFPHFIKDDNFLTTPPVIGRTTWGRHVVLS
jgi:hypothetical protein